LVATRLNCRFLIQSAKQCTPRAAGYSEFTLVATRINYHYAGRICLISTMDNGIEHLGIST
jgi:hypothetical protein